MLFQISFFLWVKSFFSSNDIMQEARVSHFFPSLSQCTAEKQSVRGNFIWLMDKQTSLSGKDLKSHL